MRLQISFFRAIFVLALISPLSVTIVNAGEYPETLRAYKGSTPVLDGIISEDEYSDAFYFTGTSDWLSDGSHTTSSIESDLSVKGWIKHDGEYLYFAFDVMDDVIYGIDIDRWVHSNNPYANELTYDKGWSWFGDGMEIMMNSTYEWDDTTSSVGDATSWQVICSTHKSTLGGLDHAGLLEGEPRNEYAWTNYKNWIVNGHMKAAVRIKPKSEGRGYVIEWQIDPSVCMHNSAGESIDLKEETRVGINLEFQDLDEKEKGEGNWSNMNHIDFLAKVPPYRKTVLKSFATLLIVPKPSCNE
ncbi:hypothetical protein ACFLSP_00760 [Bacteroidota bacterium]